MTRRYRPLVPPGSFTNPMYDTAGGPEAGTSTFDYNGTPKDWHDNPNGGILVNSLAHLHVHPMGVHHTWRRPNEIRLGATHTSLNCSPSGQSQPATTASAATVGAHATSGYMEVPVGAQATAGYMDVAPTRAAQVCSGATHKVEPLGRRRNWGFF